MANIIEINGIYLSIYKNHFKNAYIGTFLHNSVLPVLYGDTYKEIIDQANEIIGG